MSFYGYVGVAARVKVSENRHARPRHRRFTVTVEHSARPLFVGATRDGLTKREADLVAHGAAIGLMGALGSMGVDWTGEDRWEPGS